MNVLGPTKKNTLFTMLVGCTEAHLSKFSLIFDLIITLKSAQTLRCQDLAMLVPTTDRQADRPDNQTTIKMDFFIPCVYMCAGYKCSFPV